MNIILGKKAGFCGGVINSVNKSNELLDKYNNLYCLGEIVHNTRVVKSLENKGMTFIESLDEVEDGSNVVIRAHGVAKEIYEEAERRNITLLDLTCPKVLLIHKEAEDLVKDGYYIILVGKKDHPEIIGTISYCNEDSLIIESQQDVDKVVEYVINKGLNKVALLCQTTYSMSKFKEIEEMLNNSFKDIEFKVVNTICNATELRQTETEELSKQVDAMVIIGGKNSSNTKKLYEIASANTKTYLVETVDELDPSVLEYETVGVMAGASTPKESIDEVIEYLNKEKL